MAQVTGSDSTEVVKAPKGEAAAVDKKADKKVDKKADKKADKKGSGKGNVIKLR